ncbi:putative proline-rich receptor-like protein kinase PERK6 [Carica papaya]|uniref:putative proline-rich receptor-like protein kinase PERK6 n=1 Tax=Carica papaya TaxID=3649 RepID=UPI000B8D0ADB|nr:putative proline-rich receptor-like protein kinase PERK6 [Carica papaya]
MEEGSGNEQSGASPPSSPPSDSSPPPPSEESSPSPPPPSQSSPPPKESSPSPPAPENSSDKSPPPPENNNDGDNNDNNNTVPSPSPPPPPPPPPPQGRRNPGQNFNSPPRALGPPNGSNSNGNNNSSNDNDNSLSISANNRNVVIGVVVGAGLLIILMILVCVVCSKKKKRRPKHDHFHYYNDPPYQPSKVGGDYYNPSPKQPRYEHQGPTMPSPSGNWGQSPQTGGMGNWSQSPQVPPLAPPPIPGSSSDMSSNFSGPHGPSLPPPHPSVALGFNKSTFTYDELAAATQGFSQAQLLGQGGFGYVHKGVLPNGKEIAVKSLKSGSGQGEREFQAEVEIISRVHHRHLVSLVGYCIAGGQRMLVYEFLPNDTLEFHLHGKGRPVMDWPTRLKIALGSAKGLAYLHEDCHPKIIHRDIKTANILLDYSCEAKVADFGLAKLSQDNYTHVSTRVMGTFGYLAPEYASSGKLTEKSDVFSYGIMLLELITGKKPVDPEADLEDSLVDWARPLCLQAAQDGDYSQLVDPRLENKFDPHEMARMVACAAASIRHSARRRPKMSQIVRALEGDVSLDDLNEGVKPGQSAYFGSSAGSSDYDASTYSADMRKFRKLALESREYPSSEFGATSEYGLNPSSSSSEHGVGSRRISP